MKPSTSSNSNSIFISSFSNQYNSFHSSFSAVNQPREYGSEWDTDGEQTIAQQKREAEKKKRYCKQRNADERAKTKRDANAVKANPAPVNYALSNGKSHSSTIQSIGSRSMLTPEFHFLLSGRWPNTSSSQTQCWQSIQSKERSRLQIHHGHQVHITVRAEAKPQQHHHCKFHRRHVQKDDENRRNGFIGRTGLHKRNVQLGSTVFQHVLWRRHC